MTATTYPLIGDRIATTALLPGDPDSPVVGAKATVVQVNADVGQIHVAWDQPRALLLLTDDPYEILWDENDGTGPSPIPPHNAVAQSPYKIQFRDDDWDASAGKDTTQPRTQVPVHLATRSADGRWHLQKNNDCDYGDDEVIVLQRS